jgi:predicted ABC-type exoprotein transport system permease subunit
MIDWYVVWRVVAIVVIAVVWSVVDMYSTAMYWVVGIIMIGGIAGARDLYMTHRVHRQK